MRLALFVSALIFAAPAYAQLRVEVAFPNLSFSTPIDFEYADDSSGRLYVVERNGTIQVFDNDDEASSSTTFLDIRSQVSTTFEGGLLGLAFHPDYAENGHLFVSYTTPGPFRSRVSRFTRSAADPDQADPESELVLFELAQPAANHNGGDLAFGPDGYLYASFGDGGGSGDPDENGQDPTTLLGSILRLDVDGGGSAPDCGGPDANYTVPPNALNDGPGGTCDEIFAYGLRNPFRFSFDRQTGALWAGDVGQGAREEVDIVEDGDNLGWNTYEGTSCFDPPQGPPCDPSGFTFPVWEYGRSQGNSITGGFVYRGSAAPELDGKYVYGDFGSGRIWALTYSGLDDPENEELFQTELGIVSFGEDADGELYVVSLFDSVIYHITSESDTSSEGGVPEGRGRLEVYPNPATGALRVLLPAALEGPVRVALYDVLGREVAVLHEGVAPADDEALVFDAGGLPAGLYVVQVEAGDASQTQTVSLVQ
jgi:glucose/arabinose dehydrogenase